MRIFLQTGSLESGMASLVQTLKMSEAFQCLGHEVCLAVSETQKQRRDAYRLAAEILGKSPKFRIITYRKFTVGGRLSMVGGLRGFKRILSKNTFDLCFTRNPTYLEAAISSGVPTVYEAHNLRIHANGLWNWHWTSKTIRMSRHDLLKRFVCISRRLASAWSKAGVPAGKIMCEHDGVDVEAFQQGITIQEARRRLQLPLDSKLVTYAGSLGGDRSLDRIIDLAVFFPYVSFMVVGGSPNEVASMQKRARGRGVTNLILIGRVPHAQVPQYLFASDVLLMIWSSRVPTIEYCSPMKVFEYMAAGRVIVGDGFPTIHEVLTDGKNALLSAPESFKDLKSKLAHALLLPHDNSLALEAKDLAFAKHSWTGRAKRICDSIGIRIVDG